MRYALLCRPSSLHILRPSFEYRPTFPLPAAGTPPFQSSARRALFSKQSRPSTLSDSEGSDPSEGPVPHPGSVKFSQEKVQDEFASLLDEFGLADVPDSRNKDPGVKVDSMGQLTITNKAASERKHRTALVLSPAPDSLSRRDFLRIFKQGKHIAGWRVDGLEDAIPVRSVKNLDRGAGWVLLFRSPAEACDYQKRAHRLRALARQYMPDFPTSGIQPPPNYHVHGTKDLAIQDYTISTPWQDPALVAMLPPFEAWVQKAIHIHRNISSSSHKPDQVFPVRLWIDSNHQIALNKEILKRLIIWDGRVRGSHWQIVDSEDAYTRMTARLQHVILDQDNDSPDAVGPRPNDSWRVLFKTASHARRFVRIWHRRPLPDIVAVRLDDSVQPLLKAEALFQDSTF